MTRDAPKHRQSISFGCAKLLNQFARPRPSHWSITTDDLNRFFTWMEKERGIPCSPKTLSRRITSVKSFFRWLHQHGALVIDPAEKVLQRSAISPIPQVLTEMNMKPSCLQQTVTAVKKSRMPVHIPCLSAAHHCHQEKRMSRHSHQSH
jgi:site-specific recombinase XerD